MISRMMDFSIWISRWLNEKNIDRSWENFEEKSKKFLGHGIW